MRGDRIPRGLATLLRRFEPCFSDARERSAPAADECAERIDTLQLVLAELRELPPAQQRTLSLHFLDDLDVAAIAAREVVAPGDGSRAPRAWTPCCARTTRSPLREPRGVVATMLEYAGVSAPRDLDGESLTAAFNGESPSEPRSLFWLGRAMRDGSWKLIERDSGPELYDLEHDVSESTNVAAAHPERVEAMQRALSVWRAAVGP